MCCPKDEGEWGLKGILAKGLCWRVGTGINVSINDDAWIPDTVSFRLTSVVNTMRDSRVNELIDSNERIWKRELINNTFSEEDARKILRISLAQVPHNDFLVWGGEFSVRSAYKLLQTSDENPRAYTLQTVYMKFYKKKIWLLNLPTNIKVTIWRISWNYLPTRSIIQVAPDVEEELKQSIIYFVNALFQLKFGQYYQFRIFSWILIWNLYSGLPGFLISLPLVNAAFSAVHFGPSREKEILECMKRKLETG
ncbi:Ribonuclease H-like superfamily protein [Gossypium australe]|uniref:Ribonuclease H-like superfamily protein n=1 Tax=Gossypium australe TaxID=47621 RepID=A0A5B6VEU3_9ROSI|nr:Ribonuclease H-like superfamily protein [Gossypium australe]